MQCDRARDLLSAYQDGALSPDERRTLAAHIETCRSCADTLADNQRHGRLIKALPRAQVPAGLEAKIDLAIDRAGVLDSNADTAFPLAARLKLGAKGASRLATRIATLAAACLLTAFATWTYLGTRSATDRIEHDLLSAHMRALLQDNPVQVASSDKHTVRPWFAGRTDVAPDAKDFSAEGFVLLGGRLDYVAGRRVAVLVYKRRLHLIDVFVWPAANAPDGAPSTASLNGYGLLSWTKAGLTYWAVSDVNIDDLRTLQGLL